MVKRKPTRLSTYDYSQDGIYFITICTKDKAQTLATITNNTLTLSHIGQLTKTAIEKIPAIHPHASVHNYVIMPNHVHLLLAFESAGLGKIISSPTELAGGACVSTVVKGLKQYVSKASGASTWQKSFHDHVVRSDALYLKIYSYIDENPAGWQQDCFYTST